MNKKDLRALTLLGCTRVNPISDPLAVQHLYNQLYIFKTRSNQNTQSFNPLVIKEELIFVNKLPKNVGACILKPLYGLLRENLKDFFQWVNL